jgi:hypothetical protein
MPTLTNFQSYKIQAYATIHFKNGPVDVDLTSASLTYALNSIPQATLQLALGRNALTGLAATIHHFVDDMSVTLPIEVFLRVLRGPNSFGFVFENWPATFFRVFNGLVTSTGYTRTRDQVNLVINCVNWLADLNFSSCLTRQAHTLTPEMLSGPAAFQLGQGIEPAFLATTQATAFFTPANVQADMWGRSLGPWLLRICEQDVLAEPNDPKGGPGSNIEAKNALSRFEPFAYPNAVLAVGPGGQPILGQYRFSKPLKLPLVGLPGVESVALAMAEDVTAETFESMAATTMWDKLVGGFAANYRFAIVPLVDTALVVPLTAGMRTPWAVIYGQEYGAISYQDQKPRPAKGAKLFTGIGSLTGAIGNVLGAAGLQPTFGGQYLNPQIKNGMTIFANAPRWSANVVAPPHFGGQAAQPQGVRGNAFFPGQGVAPANVDPQLIRAGAKNIWDVYARHVYITEALRGRQGSLQGKLRFDIAPGSTVEVRAVQDKFVLAQTGNLAGSVLYGEVQAITHTIDAEAQQASTALQLANVRNFSENQVDATSIHKHPLYSDFWNGAPLIEDPQFLPSAQKTKQVFDK